MWDFIARLIDCRQPRDNKLNAVDRLEQIRKRTGRKLVRHVVPGDLITRIRYRGTYIGFHQPAKVPLEISSKKVTQTHSSYATEVHGTNGALRDLATRKGFIASSY